MTPRRRIGAIIGAVAALLVLIVGCGSQTPSMPSTALPQSQAPNSDCGYSWKPCATNQMSTAPDQSSGASPCASEYTFDPCYKASPTQSELPPDHQQSATWGDMKFGDCSVSLWPARVGVGVIKGFYSIPDAPSENSTRAAIYGEASTVCVGYQPKEFIIHIHLQLWSFITVPGDPHPKGAWNDSPGPQTVIASSALPPIGIINPRTGQPPFSMQHIYHVWTPCITSSTKTYRLLIDIVGVSYGGSPIVGGGNGQTFTSLPGDC